VGCIRSHVKQSFIDTRDMLVIKPLEKTRLPGPRANVPRCKICAATRTILLVVLERCVTPCDLMIPSTEPYGC
jgi:hypothetical protein